MKKVILIFICLVVPSTNASKAENYNYKEIILIYGDYNSLDNLVNELNVMEEKLNLINRDLTEYYDSNKQ